MKTEEVLKVTTKVCGSLPVYGDWLTQRLTKYPHGRVVERKGTPRDFCRPYPYHKYTLVCLHVGFKPHGMGEKFGESIETSNNLIWKWRSEKRFQNRVKGEKENFLDWAFENGPEKLVGWGEEIQSYPKNLQLSILNRVFKEFKDA